MGDIDSYAYLNAKLRAKLSFLLKEDDISSLIRTDSFETFIQQLKSFPSFAFLKSVDLDEKENGHNNRNVESAILDDFQNRMFSLVRSSGSVALKKMIHSLMRVFEIDNLKKVLSHVFFGKPINLVYHINIGKFNPEELSRVGTTDELMLKLRETEYYQVMIKSFNQFPTTQTLFFMSMDLDRYYFKCLYGTLVKADVEDRTILKKFYDIMADFSNLQNHLRLHHYYKVPPFELVTYLVPYGKIFEIMKRAVGFEISEVLSSLGIKKSSLTSRIADEFDPGVQAMLLEELESEVLYRQSRAILSSDPFNIGTLTAFYILKIRELRIVFTVMNGKYYDLPEDRIRGMM